MLRRYFTVLFVASIGACSDGGEATPSTAADAGRTADVAPAPAPLPSVEGVPELRDQNPDPRVVEVDLTTESAEIELLDGRPTTLLTYNGMAPGPMLHARVGDRVIVHFRNRLDEPTTIHWHGLRIPDRMDGNPEVVPPIQPGEEFTYDFVVPDAGTFWYHPHVNTIEQLERGLYGAIVVHEADPPRFTRERVFVLDDVRLDAQGRISPFAAAGHDVVHGRAGNVLLTNGRGARVSGAAPRGSIERWRVVNAAGSRTMTIAVEGASWRVVGTDGGLLPAPFTAERLTVAAGQRYDLEVRFDAQGAEPARLLSYVPTQSSTGTVTLSPRPVAEFRYEGTTAATPPRYPELTLPALAESPRSQTVRLGANTAGGLAFTINGHAHTAPVLEFDQNAPVRFTVINDIAPEHPFHLHGQFFQIVSRGVREANEPGLRDTVLLGPMERVVIETRLENPGRWMYHCHIPEHSENGMMAELVVRPTR